MIRTDKRMRLCVTLLIMLLVFIWGNSLLPGEVSQAFSNWVQRILFGMKSSGSAVPKGNGILRKVAHFTEFAALGMCLGWLMGMLQKHKAAAFAWGAAAACIDETIQSFVPERAPRVLDVCIDSCGVLTGLILLYFGYTYLKRRSTKHSLEDM